MVNCVSLSFRLLVWWNHLCSPLNTDESQAWTTMFTAEHIKGSVSHYLSLLFTSHFDKHLSGTIVHCCCGCWFISVSLPHFHRLLLICLFCLLQPCDPLSCASSVSLLPLFLSPCCALFVCLVWLSLGPSLATSLSPSVSFSLAWLDKLAGQIFFTYCTNECPFVQVFLCYYRLGKYCKVLVLAFSPHISACFFISGHHRLSSYLASLPLPASVPVSLTRIGNCFSLLLRFCFFFQLNNTKRLMWPWKTSAGNDLQVTVKASEEF